MLTKQIENIIIDCSHLSPVHDEKGGAYFPINRHKLAQTIAERLEINRNELELCLSFYLGEFMAKGLFEDYPKNFNKLLPKFSDVLAKSDIIKIKEPK